MKNSLVQEFEEQLKRDRDYLRAIKRNPQTYYYQLGTCIYERLYNNNDAFEMKDSFGGTNSRMEKELIKLGALKINYEPT